MITREEVYEKTIEWIQKYVPTYKFSQLTYDILKYGFENGPATYTTEEANETVFSILDKIKVKNVNSYS